MQKSKIEWCDYTINPVKGLCPMACSYCYARRMYKRFKWNPEIRYDDSVFNNLPKEPSRIFVGSTIDLFHDDIDGNFCFILDHVRKNSQHTFIFLTKNPLNLPLEFPDNCWVGVSLPLDRDNYGQDKVQRFAAMAWMKHNIKAKVKFFSFEPLLGELCIGYKSLWWGEKLKEAGINWVIIGQQTPAKLVTQPKIEWIRDIVKSADNAGAKVFLKDNLNPLFAANNCEYYTKYRDEMFTFKDFLGDGKTSWHLRQEFPV